MTHLKVAVRVRPLSDREKQVNALPIVSVENENTIAITNIKVPEQNAGDSRERVRRFIFDYCFNETSTQDEVFDAVERVVQNAIEKRYHSCVLAYGQSSSGKTHTMMGFAKNAGLTPRLCQRIFTYFLAAASEEDIANSSTTVSYLEIYNEKVRDLLVTRESSQQLPTYNILKVREHPKKGPYVQGLSEHAVQDASSLLDWLQKGNSNRKVAATLNNPESSRSHSVFTITSYGGTKLHLVDLAGSERAACKYSGTSQFREGANINKSLVALGNVIFVLAEKSSKLKSGRKRFVPYRDSLLTWLLKDTLGGNSKTIMIATVSPSNTCYSETINTLRFGQRAKQIITQPFVNEDPKEKTIRELRAEIIRLKELLHLNPNSTPTVPTQLNYRPENISDVKTCLKCSQTETVGVLMERNFNSHTSRKEECVNSLIPQQEKEIQRTEEVVPVMDIKSTIKKDKISLRRTFSASEPKIERKPSKTFGSHEGIAAAPTKNDKIRRSLPLSRRTSIEKPTKDFTLLRKSVNTAKKIEKGVVTEVKSSKTEIPKRPMKQRSEIVAAVTQRLYNKVKKKEVATETEEIKAETEVPKELAICSNARLRLQEITRRALRAHRRRDCETQTDLFPVLRVKEASTDANDLRTVLKEVKDAQTESSTETKDAETSCSLPHSTQGKALLLTRSCATQVTDDNKEFSKSTSLFSSPISFTKYLHPPFGEAKYQMLTPCTGSPIYTSSVNINVSHNSAESNKSVMNCCNDSLEDENQQNVYFPTPDLISNHSSLDTHINTGEAKTTDSNRTAEISYAETNVLVDQSTTHENVEPVLFSNVCVANCTLIPQCNESLRSINIPSACAPEICIVENFAGDRCVPLRNSYPKLEKPNIIETTVEKHIEPIHLQNTTVIKSIMKDNNGHSDAATSLESENELSDSLNYHINNNNNKKVRFSKRNSETCRMFKAMSNFLEEATSLITNLSTIASRMDSKRDHSHNYDIEITVNDVSPELVKTEEETYSTVKDLGTQTDRKYQRNSSTQTSPKRTLNASCYTDDTEIPVNKYEALVEDSCNRLERCINKAMHVEEPMPSYDQEFLHRFPQPFYATNAWTSRVSAYRTEDSSIESTPTFSDYGSLPRSNKRRYIKPINYSPSALLRHLTSMRQDIIRNSREELYSPSDEAL